jgi:hypothetical protein
MSQRQPEAEQRMPLAEVAALRGGGRIGPRAVIPECSLLHRIGLAIAGLAFHLQHGRRYDFDHALLVPLSDKRPTTLRTVVPGLAV